MVPVFSLRLAEYRSISLQREFYLSQTPSLGSLEDYRSPLYRYELLID